MSRVKMVNFLEADKILEKLRANNWTKASLAAALEVDWTTLNRWFKSGRVPLKTQEKLNQLLLLADETGEIPIIPKNSLISMLKEGYPEYSKDIRKKNNTGRSAASRGRVLSSHSLSALVEEIQLRGWTVTLMRKD